MRRPGRLGQVITLQRELEITNRTHEAVNQERIWAEQEFAHLQTSAGAANVLGTWGRCPPGTTWCAKHQKCHSHHSGLGVVPAHRHIGESITTALIIGVILLVIDHTFWK